MQVVLTEKTSFNIKKITQTTECHLSPHTILISVIYPPSFVSTGQPYNNTQNCAKSSKNHMHPSWLSGNPKVWKISWWELTSPHDLPTMISVKMMYDVQKHLMHTEVQQHAYRRRIHHIRNANCKTENIIYLLECAIYGLQYVGETKQQLSKRLNGHRSDANCKPDLPLGRHLRSTGHHDSFGKLKATIIDHNPKWDDKSRQKRESFWIKKRPYHRMESMRNSNILSRLLFFLVSYTVCPVGSMNIFHTVVGRLLNDFA